MAGSHDDGGTACAESLSEPLETQGGKQMADVITSQPKSVAVAAAPEWGVATRKHAVEAIGACVLTFVVGVSVLSGSVLTPLAAGATLTAMVLDGGHVSGRHYSPQ